MWLESSEIIYIKFKMENNIETDVFNINTLLTLGSHATGDPSSLEQRHCFSKQVERMPSSGICKSLHCSSL